MGEGNQIVGLIDCSSHGMLTVCIKSGTPRLTMEGTGLEEEVFMYTAVYTTL